MSTKNLARTVIEGGRYYGNAFDRRESHRSARSQLHAQLHVTALDPDVAEDLAFREPEHVHRWFHDKLGPADRWMRKQVGRPWRKVHSELLQRFDTKTLAGRHIVFDHMLPRPAWGLDDDTWRIARTYFRIDANGFLRLAPLPSWRQRVKKPFVSQCQINATLAWASGRKVVVYGTTRYWCEPTLDDVPAEQQRYRQARRLDEEESRVFDGLPAGCRELIVWAV